MFHIIHLILFFLLTTSVAQSWGIGSISSEMYGYDAEKHSVIGGIIVRTPGVMRTPGVTHAWGQVSHSNIHYLELAKKRIKRLKRKTTFQ